MHGLPNTHARRLQDPVRRRPHPPHAAAHRGPVSLPALCRQLPRGRPALRDGAGEAGGHLAVRPEPDVSGREGFPATRASSSSTTCCASTRPRSGAACDKGAHKVQIDFTEGRLAMKIDPSGHLLHSFIDLNNLALSRFSAEERERIGVHTCPGGDRDSTHSADVDYAELLPSLFELKVGNFYVALAGETRPRARAEDHPAAHEARPAGLRRRRSRRSTRASRRRRRSATASSRRPSTSRSISSGTTDDCGFSPFSDDTSTSRETAFAKIRSRVLGTALAARAPRGVAREAGRRRGRAAALGRAPERARASCSPASAPSRSCSGPRRRSRARPTSWPTRSR